MSIAIYQVDAFTDEVFSGNPACVCLMSETRTDAWCQSVAAEMNLSETAFVWKSNGCFHLRWFTPLAEVELCGHATLATAHVLWLSGWLDSDSDAVFDSLSGQLTAKRNGSQIELDFPAKKIRKAEPVKGLLESLDVESTFVGTDGTDFLVEVESHSVLQSMSPDFHQLANVDARGIIATCKSQIEEFDFVSRFFAPAVGINEDPVTGSAHCALAPYWGAKLERHEMIAYQASRRGGKISLKLENDRVLLGGRAKTVFEGELLV